MLPDRQTLQGSLAPSAHLSMQFFHGIRSGRDEQEGKQPMQYAADTRDQHPETEGCRLQQMTEVGFTDAGRMGSEEA